MYFLYKDGDFPASELLVYQRVLSLESGGVKPMTGETVQLIELLSPLSHLVKISHEKVLPTCPRRFFV